MCYDYNIFYSSKLQYTLFAHVRDKTLKNLISLFDAWMPIFAAKF